jgi:hypothetical protein
MAGLKTTVVVGGKVENTTTTQMCSTAVLAKTGASMGLKMGDYDMDGAYNPQLASPAPLEYVEPKDITPDAIEDDMYSTDQIAQMYCRIKALEAQVEAAETIIKAMHREHNEAQERLAGSLLNAHKETQAKLEALEGENTKLRGFLQQCVDSDMDCSSVESELWCEIEAALENDDG